MPAVNETMELLKAVNEIAMFFVKRLKDGVGVDDAMAFYEVISKDAEFKEMLFKAYENAKEIPAEVKDLDYQEVIALILEQLKYIPKFIQTVKEP